MFRASGGKRKDGRGLQVEQKKTEQSRSHGQIANKTIKNIETVPWTMDDHGAFMEPIVIAINFNIGDYIGLPQS